MNLLKALPDGRYRDPGTLVLSICRPFFLYHDASKISCEGPETTLRSYTYIGMRLLSLEHYIDMLSTLLAESLICEYHVLVATRETHSSKTRWET